MRAFNTKIILENGLLAALYIALTGIVFPLAFNAIQFRISEVLILIVFYRKELSPGLLIGTFIANLYSPAGILDATFGTLATLISVLLMNTTKHLLWASLYPVVVNGMIVGALLTSIEQTPFWWNASMVAIGEFAVVAVVGIPLLTALRSNRTISHYLGLHSHG